MEALTGNTSNAVPIKHLLPLRFEGGKIIVEVDDNAKRRSPLFYIVIV